MRLPGWHTQTSLVETPHLKLEPNDPGQLLVLVEDETAAPNLLGRPMAAGIREYLLSASSEFCARLRAASGPDPWKFGFAIIAKENNHVIGMCGFTGPPNDTGVVEIAYSIAPAYQGKGYATEAAGALIEIARAEPAVRLICAHTLAEHNASSRVLEKCGLRKVGEAMEDDLPIWRWEL
jgi:GNAT superfamily N-acetyltransferase